MHFWGDDIMITNNNKMVLEPNVSLHKQIVRDYNVKECISIEEMEN